MEIAKNVKRKSERKKEYNMNTTHTRKVQHEKRLIMNGTPKT